MKKIKSIICVALSVGMAFLISVSIGASENVKPNLQDLSEEECLEVLLDNGLEIPEAYKDFSDTAGFVKLVTESVLKNPSRVSWYNYVETQNFALAIREVVLEYAGIEEDDLLSSDSVSTYATASSLQYSTLVGSWSTSYSSYNCYAYAVNKTNLGIICPGNAIGYVMDPEHLRTMAAMRLASLVAYDLQEWGYTNITYGETKPSWESGYRIIAVRKTADADVEDPDFHCMYMYSSSNVWRHKPSTTWLLKYNYTSLTSGKWTNEAVKPQYINGVLTPVYYEADVEYDSEIIYIKYKL